MCVECGKRLKRVENFSTVLAPTDVEKYNSVMSYQQRTHIEHTAVHTLSLEKSISSEACREKLSLSWDDVGLIISALKKYGVPNYQTGCIEWGRSCHERGYGKIFIDSKQCTVHRVSANLFLDMPLDSDLFVCHKCDNPRCFRPSHLFLGTHQDNMQDRVIKNKLKKGNTLLRLF